jgi:hypothetical protein
MFLLELSPGALLILEVLGLLGFLLLVVVGLLILLAIEFVEGVYVVGEVPLLKK